MRLQIQKLDVAATKEPGGGVRNPEWPLGWLLGKNGFLVDENQGLSNYELGESFRGSRIVPTYQVMGEISRRNKSMGNT